MERYKRNSIFEELKKYDHLANKNAFIEVTEWKNGEGMDVAINSTRNSNFQLTYGEFLALKKIVKKLWGKNKH